MLEETDVAPRPWLGFPGWPIERGELMPFYARGCRTLGVPDLTAVRTDRFRDGKGFLVQNDDLGVATLYWPRHPLRFGHRLERAVRDDRELETYLFAHVTQLVPSADGGVGRVRDGPRPWPIGRSRFDRTVVVLACGGIENARLLLASANDRGRPRQRPRRGGSLLHGPPEGGRRERLARPGRGAAAPPRVLGQPSRPLPAGGAPLPGEAGGGRAPRRLPALPPDPGHGGTGHRGPSRAPSPAHLRDPQPEGAR